MTNNTQCECLQLQFFYVSIENPVKSLRGKVLIKGMRLLIEKAVFTETDPTISIEKLSIHFHTSIKWMHWGRKVTLLWNFSLFWFGDF